MWVPLDNRRPDVTVYRADSIDITPTRPEHVLLIVEVVSPGSETTDRVVKADQYANAAILVSVYAVLSVLNARHSEERGLTDLILTTGVRRWTPLAAQAMVTAAGCAVILTVTGFVTAMTAPPVINGDDIAARSLAYTVGQWPATIAVTGCTVLLIGFRPAMAWLAWIPLVASAALALLGDLLRIPDTTQRLGVFRHVPDISATDPNITALGVLLCIGAASCLIGTAARARRNIAL